MTNPLRPAKPLSIVLFPWCLQSLLGGPREDLSYLPHSQLRSIHLLVVTLSYTITIIVLSPVRRKLSGCLGGKRMDAQTSQGQSCRGTEDEDALPSSVLTHWFSLSDSRRKWCPLLLLFSWLYFPLPYFLFVLNRLQREEKIQIADFIPHGYLCFGSKIFIQNTWTFDFWQLENSFS